MHLVIDANVFAAFFRSKTNRGGESLTGDPCFLFDTTDAERRIAFDDTRHIEEEWMKVVPTEWARAWIGDALVMGKIVYYRPIIDPSLINLLKQFGFPLRGSHDLWYLCRLPVNLIQA